MAIGITWYGTASIRIDVEGLSLLFDPFVPLPGASSSMTAEHFLPAPHILITHGHLDHAGCVPDLVSLGAGKVYVTDAPHFSLTKQGLSPEVLHLIKPSERLRFFAKSGDLDEGSMEMYGSAGMLGSAGVGETDACADIVTVEVKRGRHIRFDVPLVLSTFFNRRMLSFAHNARELLKRNRAFPEKNETVVYEVSYNDRLITLMGSLGLNKDESYTQNPDLLVLPHQGHSHLEPIALSVIESLKPRMVLLDHFDDAFPPISRMVDTTPLVRAIAHLHPQIPLIVPEYFVTQFI